jgi:hypothetical protein
MVSNKYTTKAELTTSPISGGRLIHTYRHGIEAADTYEHELEVGQGFHTLALLIFGNDEYWWTLQDLNPISDPFRFKVGTKVTLPKRFANNGRKRIF